MTDVATTNAPRPATSALVLVGFLLLAYAVAAFGAAATIQNVEGWYADAMKAPWSPPNALFGPVWTLLYSMMSVAAWLVWRAWASRPADDRGPGRAALVAYGVQLALNAAWTPVFFGLVPVLGSTASWLALLIVVLLDVALPITIVRFWRISRIAALLLVPYWLWVLFATTLNAAVAVLNG